MMITPILVPRADDNASNEPSTSVLAKLLQRLADATTASPASSTETLLDRASAYADSQPSFAADLRAAASSAEALACA